MQAEPGLNNNSEWARREESFGPLPERFRQNVALNEPVQATFYEPGPKGYTDYPALPPAAL
jgi:hypothetical protein